MTTEEGVEYVFYHNQDCCEDVYITDICGDLRNLIGSEITKAEESTSDKNIEGIEPPEYQEIFMWTFYKFATSLGYVDVRWHGDSNGYYSVEVRLKKIIEVEE